MGFIGKYFFYVQSVACELLRYMFADSFLSILKRIAEQCYMKAKERM